MRRIGRTRALSRLARNASAWMLVVLAAVPFTAPFAGCDLATLLQSPHEATAESWSSPHVGGPSIRGSSEPGVGSMLDEEQFNVEVSSMMETYAPLGVGADVPPPVVVRQTHISIPLLALRL